MTRRRRRCAFVLWPLVLAPPALLACVQQDPYREEPIWPLDVEVRTPLLVTEIENRSPEALVAGLTADSRALLLELLARSKRFRVVAAGDAARYRLETAIRSFREEDRSESVIHARATTEGRRRAAVVELSYRLVDPGGRVFVEGLVVGESLELGVERLAVPRLQDLETGAFWNSPYGLATRSCLDQVVRVLADLM